jgi:hypothetical protein
LIVDKSLAEKPPRPGHSRVTAINQNARGLHSCEGYKVPAKGILSINMYVYIYIFIMYVYIYLLCIYIYIFIMYLYYVYIEIIPLISFILNKPLRRG